MRKIFRKSTNGLLKTLRLKTNKSLTAEKFMKILLTIHHHLDPNTGAPGSTLKLGREYQKLGHQVEYYSFDNLPKWINPKAKSFVFSWFVAARIFNLCRQKAIDAIDASTGNAWVWGKILRKAINNPPILITRSHGLEHIVHLENLEEAKRNNLHLSWKYPLYHGGYRLWEVSTSLRCADLVLQRNSYDRDYAIENLGVSSERSRIVPYGIPDRLINLPIEPISDRENATIAIAVIGNYIQRKGIDYSIPALNKILIRYPQVKLSLLGTGIAAENVYVDFEPMVRDRILVLPRYDNKQLPELLKEHQIKLLPSLAEGFGIVLIEAMACSLAPVTTAIQGPRDIVSDGQDGLLIPPRNSQAIERALEKLIVNRPYLEQLRRHAHATAQSYSWSRIARDTIDLYEEALTRKRAIETRQETKCA
jgi:glycosyltransferase involved in cell wall biosynthesis